MGKAWTTRDGGSGSKTDLLWMALSLTGHCHVGVFTLPWSADEWVECPYYRDVFTGGHLLWDCRRLFEERQRL